MAFSYIGLFARHVFYAHILVYSAAKVACSSFVTMCAHAGAIVRDRWNDSHSF